MTAPTHPTSTQPEQSVNTMRMLIDLPNLNGHLRDMGWTRSRDERLDFINLAATMSARAAGFDALDITVFMQVERNQPQVAGFVTMLRHAGIGVYARPVGDIDDNIVAAVEADPAIAALWISTHDVELIGRCTTAASNDTLVNVTGFEECSLHAIRSDRTTFVDLGDLGGFIPASVPRDPISRLPDHGTLFPPHQILRPAPSASPLAA